jgi:hypothetical protein
MLNLSHPAHLKLMFEASSEGRFEAALLGRI